jgi:hypothetical protein
MPTRIVPIAGCENANRVAASVRFADNPDVVIGSYPFFDLPHGANTNVVLRARDAQKLAQAKHAVEDMLERVRRAQSNSS